MAKEIDPNAATSAATAGTTVAAETTGADKPGATAGTAVSTRTAITAVDSAKDKVFATPTAGATVATGPTATDQPAGAAVAAITATAAGVHCRLKKCAAASGGSVAASSTVAAVAEEEGMATVTAAPAAEPRIVVGGSERGDSSRPSVATVAHNEPGVTTATAIGEHAARPARATVTEPPGMTSVAAGPAPRGH
ncbi:hypothetical protein LAUMK4_03847 [Mycobacterium persicum]|uniref:Uncharacterized protein n=1 Tax=Mycobacterium persicum TaxID=1487726 RepID=A0AB38UZ51_9MYCO|nr:hypothetical protein LAUMK42_03913 [Mycobacterium persicum]VAZ97436.1 hypothetical protein LAUMK4_03847 [Mycobacterium persicum]